MSNTITVAGTNLLTAFGAYVFEKNTFLAPERDYTFYKVPGYDGAEVGKSARLNNVIIEYDVIIPTNAKANLADLRSFLLSRKGYFQIIDENHPDEYRVGAYVGPFEPVLTPELDMGKVVIAFNCRPQRRLTSGATAVEFTSSSKSFDNPTRFESKPLVRVYGYGDVTFQIPSDSSSVRKISISDYTGISGVTYIDIDCQTMECYSIASGSNDLVNLQEYVFFRTNNLNDASDPPVLYTGRTTVYNSSTSTISKIAVTPRWWTV